MPASARSVERASSREIASRLPSWTRLAPDVALHTDLTGTPQPWIADWLGALRRAGHVVSWSGTPPAVAMTVEALPDPAGGLRIDVAAPRGAQVTLRDAASVLDSVRVAALGATVTTPIAVDSVVAEVNGAVSSATLPGPARVRPVLVIGRAGWEGKFIARALEERGWPVVARFSVAPRVDVTQGAAAPLDTSRFSAVIAIDSSVASLGAAALEQYVRDGGGLVLVGSAGSVASVASLAPGSLGERTRPAVLPADTVGLGATGFYPVGALKANAAALDRHAGSIAIAARRVGAGRVVQVGYDDSWRWRMAGGPGSEASHRAWWSRIAGSAAYVPAAAHPPTVPGADAPLAYLVERVGPARLGAPESAGRGVDQRILMALVLVLLCIEWGSRRLRGMA